MIRYTLPTFVTVDGKQYHIRNDGDFRVILDVISVQNENELNDVQKAYMTFSLFFDEEIPEDKKSAWGEIKRFINCGEEESENRDSTPPVTDLEQDFPLYIGAVNKALGYECRLQKYVHWWQWMDSGYKQIDPESRYCNIVQIRQKLYDPGKYGKLTQQERLFAEENKEIIYLKHRFSDEESSYLFGID